MTFVAGQVLTAAQLNVLDITSLTVDTDTLVVDATNDRVGINQASPSVALDVGGSVVIDDDLTVDTTTLVVDSTNNRVGIGTASPAANLQVVSQNRAFSVIDSGTTNYAEAAFTTLGGDGPALGRLSGYDIQFQTGTTRGGLSTRMHLDNDGRVGIGTTTPSAELEVRGTSSPEIRIIASDGTDPALYFGDSVDNVRGGIVFDTSTNDMLFRGYNNSTKMTIESDGQIGIGTTGPTETFDVNGTARIRSTIKLGANQIVLSQVSSHGSLRVAGSSGYIDVGPKNASYAHIYTDRGSFYFNKNINLGGTTSSEGGEMVLQNGTSYSLDWKVDNFQNQFRIFNSGLLAGDVRILYLNTTTGNNTVRWTSSGQILRFTSLTERKTDIESIDGILGYLNERNPLYDLSPKLFHEKDQPNADGEAGNTTRGEYIYGMLAEDVYEVLPELCNTDGRGKLNGFAIESLIPLLVAEVQRLGGMVETLYGVHDSSYVPPVPRPASRADDEKRIFEAAIPGERAAYNDLRDQIISKYDGVEGREGITLPPELPPLEDA